MPSLPWVDAIKAKGMQAMLRAIRNGVWEHYDGHISVGVDFPEEMVDHAEAELSRLLRAVEVLEPLVDIIAGMPCESLIDGDEDCAASGAEDDDPGAWCLTCSARRALADVREG